MTQEKYKVILFYRFFDPGDLAVFKEQQKFLASKYNLKGRMLIAKEGINATFEGLSTDTAGYANELRQHPALKDMVIKESEGNGRAFTKLAVKVRKEIVTMEAGEFDVAKETAKEITAEELEKLYENNEDFVVLDLRNDFEIEVGKFDKTLDPGLRNFRDLKEKLPALAKLKDKKVVTVCTGGIRCEKATCLMTREGFKDIYQLKDGIHTYMQKYPGKHFRGRLFVFDNRMVTPVVASKDREVIGKCRFCSVPCEEFYNDDSVRPSKKIICCATCKEGHPELRVAVAS
jgi:UPF0176 protein